MTSSDPHLIRLRAPWELGADSLARSRRFNRPTGLTARHRVELVAESLAKNLADSLAENRAESASEHAGENAVAPATLELNGRTLGRLLPEAPAFRCDITAWLEPRNLLTIRYDDRPASASPVVSSPVAASSADEASSPGAAPSLGRSDAPAEVRLEIHEPGRNDQDTSHQGANN